ncbi:zinc ABC transporter substrate-binding protein [Actinomadura sp. WMMB 499]|nr:zinc ABC transporter substrate-binding protein [Actinomadura sp. WMMB 499]
MATALSACGSSGAEADPADGGGAGGPKVVAASTWEAAFARAAGARDVTVIVPPGITHPPDYDPKPSDIAKVAGADFVLYAAFEGFAPKLRSAAGSGAELIELELDNGPAAVESEVTRLGGEFGTAAAARTWLTSFDTVYAAESRKAAAAYRQAGEPPVVAQAFVTWAAEMLGARPVGTYGPQPPTASRVAELAGKKPGLVLDNSAMPGADALSSIEAERVTVVNFPDQNMDLLSVYRSTVRALTTALDG